MPRVAEGYSRKNALYLIVILVAATAVTTLGSIFTYRNSLIAAEDSLKSQALGIAVSLEASVSKTTSEGGNIFKDIIVDGTWEGIAFIALYDSKGLTILHSNENLIGRHIEDPYIKEVAATGKPVYYYAALGTGEKAFVLNFPIHLRDTVRILRLALHTYPAEEIIRQAEFQMVSVSIVIVILWIMGFFFIKAVRRAEEYQQSMAERERLAVLGEMSSVLAHEIRNPLGSIKGFAQYLIEQASETRSSRADNAREYLDIIVSESKRIEALTGDLLVYAKPADVRAEPFNLRALIEEILQAMHHSGQMVTNIDVKVSVQSDIDVVSDKEKLRQIATNIIQNSVDAMNNGGTLEIRAHSINELITLSVKDTGSGMDSNTKERLFKPFFTTKTTGTGLGLAIVEQLVKSIKGTIGVESRLQEGTVFTVTIPRKLTKTS